LKPVEVRGFLIRCGEDAPWAGTLGSRALDGLSPSRAGEPWMALRQLAELSRLLPGGLHLVWQEPPSWYAALEPDAARGFWEAVGALPNLRVHVAEVPDALRLASFAPWLHAEAAPAEAEGEAWRAGALGFVPKSGRGWRLPGFGRLGEAGSGVLHGDDPAPAFLWGEIAVPLPALAYLDADLLAAALTDQQSALERGLAHRLGLHAWPTAFPFQRRRSQWRLAVLGGAEHLLSGGTWAEAADRLAALAEALGARLKAPLQLGACDAPEVALALGRQAMGEGLPWRSALPLPPASPSFTPGLAADPRRPSPLESRAFLPRELADRLDAPPESRLRVPAPPSAAAVESLLAALPACPALRWMPPGIPEPGPFTAEHAWAPAADFPYPADPAAGVQLSLFEDLEA
jgi:hypothetical protein